MDFIDFARIVILEFINTFIKKYNIIVDINYATEILNKHTWISASPQTGNDLISYL